MGASVGFAIRKFTAPKLLCHLNSVWGPSYWLDWKVIFSSWTHLFDDLAASTWSYLAEQGQYELLCHRRMKIPHVPMWKSKHMSSVYFAEVYVTKFDWSIETGKWSQEIHAKYRGHTYRVRGLVSSPEFCNRKKSQKRLKNAQNTWNSHGKHGYLSRHYGDHTPKKTAIRMRPPWIVGYDRQSLQLCWL